MVEPIGLIGTVFGVIGLSAQVAKQLNDIRSQYKFANSTLSAISSECNVISAALQQIQALVTQQRGEVSSKLGPNSSMSNAFDTALQGCEATLTVLDLECAKLGAEMRKGGVSLLMSRSVKLKFVWKESTMKDLLLQLRSQHAALNLLITTFQMGTIFEVQQSLNTNSAVIQRVADDMEGLRVRYTKSKLSAPEVLSTHSRPTYAASVFSGLSDTEFAFDEQIVGTTAYRRALAKPTTASPSQPTSPMAPRPYTPIPISTPLKKAPHAIRVKALFGDSQKLFKDLMKAIKKDDFKKVRELIDLAAPLNVFSTESKFTPLTYAIYHKRNPAIISLLLDARAGPRLLDGDERSPVSCAVDMGDMSIVRSLIRHGVSVVHEEISNGQSLWEKSVKENHPELIEMLVREFGADVHRKEKYGVTALQIATADENQATVEMLLRLGAEY